MGQGNVLPADMARLTASLAGKRTSIHTEMKLDEWFSPACGLEQQRASDQSCPFIRDPI